jgi:uncharacterized protein (TIGR04222 family)
VYLGALLFPALLGVVWWARQVRGRGDGPVRELSRHELAYLDGGRRGVVLTAVRRLRAAGVLKVSERGLIHAGTPRPRVPDRIDGVIVANADHVYPKAFAYPLRPALRRIARRLEDDGLLVERREVWRRWRTVALVEVGCCAAALALVIVGLVSGRWPGREVLFLAGAVLTVVVTLRSPRGGPVLTRRGEQALVIAGLRRPPREAWRARLRKFTALATLLALLTRTSVAVPERDGDDPDAWADDAGGGADWSDSHSDGFGDGFGDGGSFGWGGDGGGGDSGGGGGGGGES